MNEKAEFAVEVLKQYAVENQVTARSTSDLSVLEQWLILRLLTVTKSLPDSGRSNLLCEGCKQIIVRVPL